MPLPPVLDRIRHVLGEDVRGLLGTQPLKPESFRRSAADPGLFGPNDVVWRVHADRCGLIGGLRALLLQTLHPLAMAGVAEHSDYRHDPWGRLGRTAAFIAVTTYGSTSAAEALIRRVRTIHDAVEGVAADGRPYRANDPHLLAWVHACEVDSFLRAYQRYGGSTLEPLDADRYVAETAQIASRLGVVDPPQDRAELRQVLLDFRPELQVTASARQAVRYVAWPPLPLYLRPAYGVLISAAAGLLPRFDRRELRIVLAPLSDPLLVQPAARLVLGALGLTLGAQPPALKLVEEQSAQAEPGPAAS